MDWTKLSPQEFATRLSLEGLAAAPEISAQYDNLPWSLKILWWATSRPSTLIDWLSIVALPGTYDPDPGFWGQINERTIKGHHQGYYDRDLSVEARSFAWFDDLREESNEIRPTIFRKILSGEISNQAAEELFQDYDKDYPYRALFDISQDTKESVWDELWEEHGSTIILSHPYVPPACIDRWRSVQQPEHERNLIFITAIRRRPTLPEHWIQEILSRPDDPPDTNALIAYLEREDIPLDTRKAYRKHRNVYVQKAAWKHGEYTDQELDYIKLPDWHILLDRQGPIGLSMLAGVFKNVSPSVFWSQNPVFSPEAQLFLLKNGEPPLWEEDTDPRVLDAALASDQLRWQDMADNAFASWGHLRLKKLLNLTLSLPDTPMWTVKRLLHLGNITPDKPILKTMLASQSKEVRLLGSKLLGSLGTPQQNLRR